MLQQSYIRLCRTAATPNMEWFVIIVNGWKQLTIITKRSILDFAAVLDLPLVCTEVACFQASILLKVNFSTKTFRGFVNCLGTNISRNAC